MDRVPIATCSVIVGLQGSGKSELAAVLAEQYKRVWVYDPMEQYDKLKNSMCYVPTNRGYGQATKHEVTEFVNFMLSQLKHEWAYIEKGELFIMDETSLFCPNKRPLPAGIQLLNDTHRHRGLDLMFIARRPAQIHTDLVELAHDMYIFLLKGRNDHQYLRDINPEVSGAVGKLKDFQYVHVDKMREFKLEGPVSLCRGGKGLSQN